MGVQKRLRISKTKEFELFKEKSVKMAEDNFPIIDFSQIPGCESPVGNSFRSSTSSSKLTTSNTTRSRISSIFSSNADSDDDPFDLKASARKFKAKRESKIHIGRLVDIRKLRTLMNCWPKVPITVVLCAPSRRKTYVQLRLITICQGKL